MSRTIFVTLATGQQGQALSKELLRRGYAVKSLTRNLQSDKAVELTKLGAKLIEGQISSPDDVHAALAGVDAVWLALPASLDEVGTGRAIIDAARGRGIKQFVYSTVARTGDHESFPGWSDSDPMSWYWTNKAALEDAVRGAGFESWTILRPAFFTQNFCRPVVDYMYPELITEHILRVAYRPDTRLDLIDTAGIASAGANAFDSPDKFHGKELALASEKLTAQEIADTLGRITGHAIKVVYLNDDEIKEAQKLGPIVDSQVWARDVGYNVDLAACRENNVKTSTMVEALTKEQLGW